MVFFIEAIGCNRVRIGHAEDVQIAFARIAASSRNELRIAHLVYGGEEETRAYHRRFARHHATRGWFFAAPIFAALRIKSSTKADRVRPPSLLRDLLYDLRAAEAHHAGQE